MFDRLVLKRCGQVIKSRATCYSIFHLGSVAVFLISINSPSVFGAQNAKEENGPPLVNVVSVERKEILLTKELPGRVAPIRIAEVRPRVSGIVIERSFVQGSIVEKGAVLYRIDPTPFEIDLESARAALAKSEASFSQLDKQEDRVRSLLPNATTQAQYELALAGERQAQAELNNQRAAVRRAEVNLEYATVRAPIKGRIGRALVTEGALISEGQAPVLAIIQQLDPIYADFTQSVAEIDELKDEIAQGGLKRLGTSLIEARLILDGGRVYPYTGKVLFSDITVDPGTNQVALRAEFPNPAADLLPGSYVRVQIEQGVRSSAITIPRQAVQRNSAGGAEVYVVNDENRAIIQPIREGRILGDSVLVEEGLNANNRVIVEGFQKITSGSLVSPQVWKRSVP